MNKATGAFLLRYGVALFAVALMILCELVLDPVLGQELSVPLLLVVVIASAWFGGLGPGLSSLALWVLAAESLLPDPPFERSFRSGGVNEAVRLALFLSVATLMCWLTAIARDVSAHKRAKEALQASEERFRRIIETANEGIWLIDAQAHTSLINQRMADMLGCQVEEMAGRAVHEFVFEEDQPAARERIGQNLQGRLERFDFRLRRLDGTAVHVLGGTSPVTNARGQVIGALGMFSDITDRRLAEQRLRIRHDVTLRLARAGTVAEAARGVLEAICLGLDWSLGIFWRRDERAGALRVIEVWNAPGAAFPDFIRRSRANDFEAGVGLPGRVWVRGEPAWITDVAEDDNFPRASAAVQEGLHGAFAFPILLGNETLGVVEFFCRQPCAPDKDVLDMMMVLGSQIGQFLERARAEEAVRESEARKAAILATALDGIISMDHEGRILEFNPAAETMFGYSQSEAVGNDWANLIMPPRLREAYRRDLANYVATGEGFIIGRRLELPAVDANGMEFPVELSVLQIAAKNPPVFTTYVRDISERKEAERAIRENAARFRQLAEAMPQIVWTANAEGRTEYINQQWCRYTGLPAEQANDPQRLAEITHPEDRAELNERWKKALAAGTPYEFEFRLKRTADGAYRWFLSRAVPIKNEQGQVLHWYGTSTDIDDQKRTEESLKAADRRKDEFLAMLSHELRNPLAPIRNALHLMRMARLDDAALIEARDVVERQVRQMTVMIDDLLDIFRISHHKITLRTEPLDLAKLVRQTVEDHRKLLEESRLTVDLKIPEAAVWITGDYMRLSQVLLNLLHNAAKFSNPGDKVIVRLLADDMEQRTSVIVRDTGFGISAEMLPHVFDTFTQAEQSLDRRRGGLGLGLALVKGIVELHGGEVSAASLGPGQGAEFTFWLPWHQKPKPISQSAPGVIPSEKRLRILIVEDNRDTAKTLALLLRRYGHDVMTAHSGTMGVQAAKQWRPDIVLCDLGLPEMDGYEVASALRQDPVTAAARLIAVSGYGREEDRQRSEEAGFDLHLTKPVDPGDLQSLLTVLNGSLPHEAERHRVIAQESV